MKKYCLLVFCMLVLVSMGAVAAEKRTSVAIGNSPSMGPENAPVTIIEFVDFQ